MGAGQAGCSGDRPLVADRNRLVDLCQPGGNRDPAGEARLAIRADAGVLPGIDGEKMSKSYGNTIDPFLPEKKLRKLINKVVTDSTPMEDAKVPENCTVYKIFKALAGSDDQRTQDLADQYRAGGMGYGHAKKALADLILDHFGPARKLREELMADPAYVQQVLADGAAAAQAKVAAVTDRVRKAVGL